MSADHSICGKVLQYIRLVFAAPKSLERLLGDVERLSGKIQILADQNERATLQIVRNQVLLMNGVHQLREDMHAEILIFEARQAERLAEMSKTTPASNKQKPS